MLAQLFAVMAPVLIGAGLGFTWVRLGHDFPVPFVTKLVFNIGTPALILASLSGAEVDAQSFTLTMLGTLLVLAVMAMATLLVAPLLGKPWQVLLSPMMYPNTGNMGLPVVLYAFGPSAFAFAVAVMVTVSLVQFTFGIAMSSRSGRPLRTLARTPALYAIAIALTLLLTDTDLPLWLDNTLELISGFTVPLMLITLGVSLANIRVSNLAAGLGFSVMRIPLAALLAFGIGHLLALPPLAQSILVVQMSMPVAVFNYLFAQRSGREPEYVASLVFCSTLLAFLYLPALLAFLL
ncbi:AEC family transporter [Halomonas sp. YLGW01]|uniref:AEC family transporter n=1 Tax=Halomonas sp. YLGW01 TaxID=2773308 RepID=UPI00177A8945|nr:AEC family transporter [Halomonas sp. YLGW01]